MVKFMKAKYILASLVILVFLFVGASCASSSRHWFLNTNGVSDSKSIRSPINS